MLQKFLFCIRILPLVAWLRTNYCSNWFQRSWLNGWSPPITYEFQTRRLTTRRHFGEMVLMFIRIQPWRIKPTEENFTRVKNGEQSKFLILPKSVQHIVHDSLVVRAMLLQIHLNPLAAFFIYIRTMDYGCAINSAFPLSWQRGI